MPFAGYGDFEDCVAKNQDKSDPAAFCGWLKNKVEKSTADSFVMKMNQVLTLLRSPQAKDHSQEVIKSLSEIKSQEPKKFKEEALAYLADAIIALTEGNYEAAAGLLEDAISAIEGYGTPEGSPEEEAAAMARKFAKSAVIDNVEIFKVGTWNGDTYTPRDLDDMVQNFGVLRDKVKPPVKLGHAEDQKFLKQEGLPAAGWIDSVKRMGDTLYAKVRDVPRVIADLVRRKAYRRVSAEIYPVYKDPATGKLYKNVLRAIAFLGGDIPAVETLKDITSLYSLDPSQEFKAYALDQINYKFTVKSGLYVPSPDVRILVTVPKGGV